MENLTIRPYRPEDWSRLAAVHDDARLQELRLAGLEEAFLPLEIAAERENLFDYTLRVAEWDGQIAGSMWTPPICAGESGLSWSGMCGSTPPPSPSPSKSWREMNPRWLSIRPWVFRLWIPRQAPCLATRRSR